MIELIERTLCSGGDLEQARMDLLNQANIDRMNRNNTIEHDFRIAMLIRECLMTEPKGSSGYAVAKGIMNRLKEQYRDPVIESAVRKLKKSIECEKIKEETKNGGINKAKRQTDLVGTE